MPTHAVAARTPSPRRPLVAVPALCLVLWAVATGVVAAGPRQPVPGPAAITAAIDPAHPGPLVARSFVGLSIEYPSLLAYAGPAGHPDGAFAALLRTLARAQRAPPALRIGGNSADRAWWNPAGAPRPPSVRIDLGHRWLAALAALEHRVHAPLTLTLDLALQRPANALALARAAQAALPAGTLRALEIGNEPDIYGRRMPTGAGVLGPSPFPRLGRYTRARYVRDVARYARALAGGLSRPPAVVAGGFAGTAWQRTVPLLLHRHRGAAQRVAIHAYPLFGCGRRRGGSVAGLLSDAAARAPARQVLRALALNRAPPAAVRVAELNSVACGGRAGVSDTFAAALWSADALFGLARTGVSGVNVHTFAGARYAPFTVARVHGRWLVRVRPEYSGLLLFARATPYPCRLLPVRMPAAGALGVWATAGSRGTVRVVAVNRSPSATRALTLVVRGRRGAAARAVLLRAPSAAARAAVTLGGRSIGTDGRPHGRPSALRLPARRGALRLVLPPASGALVTVPAVS
ncbi:MAG: hypothetical protein ACXVFL_09995 [Solirubrobacteraceae bacterium]